MQEGLQQVKDLQLQKNEEVLWTTLPWWEQEKHIVSELSKTIK
jgi:hypothetical protein